MSDRQFQFTAYSADDLELTVTYSCTPFVDATYWQPAEGGEVEIVAVTHEGRPMPLSAADEGRLHDLASERAAEDMAAEAADEADYRYEQYRDRLLDTADARGEGL